MKKTVYISIKKFATSSPRKKQQCLRVLTCASKRSNGAAVKDLAGRIIAFERKTGISSEQMLREVRAAQRRETAEIAEWMMLLDSERRVATKSS